MKATDYIQLLQLQPHPEGGFYKETYKSAELMPHFQNGRRHVCTAIYFLLEKGNFSAFHRIKSDEMWHFYAGDPILIHVLNADGALVTHLLGNQLQSGQQLQLVVPAGCWFASETAPEGNFSLVGCTVAPGFDFDDFELASPEGLTKIYPHHSNIINRLCR